MKTKYFMILIVVFLTMSIFNAQAVNNNDDINYGFDTWPGKDGPVKKSIELPIAPLMGYGLVLCTVCYDWLIDFNLPIDDDPYKGWLRIHIFPTVKEAQQGLVDHMDTLQNPNKPARLTDEEFSPGDVALGKEYILSNCYLLFFTRSNVFVILKTPPDIIQELAYKVDKIIKESPNGISGDPSAKIIITEEFKQAFSEGSTAVNEGTTAEQPQAFTLFQNLPNPFNHATAISYEITKAGMVSLRVYDIVGHEVAALEEGYMQPGRYQVLWNGKDSKGNTVSSGIYLYRMRAGGKEETKRMTLVR